VVVDLRALEYCDAHGLRALGRMCIYAEQSGCSFRLSSPSLSIIRILRITGLDRTFPLFHAPVPADN
jgi:anti-anti-sigma factor